jgi:CheY-like chemotaxis protein
MTLVLIVDDSPLDRALAGGILGKQLGCRVIYAEDGAAGFASIRNHRPDLVVTDMQMPAMNGLEMVAAVRKEGLQTPIILMTATGSEELAVEALQAGASSYVAKRSLAKRLMETAKMVLAEASEDREENLLMNRLRIHSESFQLTNRVEECRTLSKYLQKRVAQIWTLNQSSRLRIGLVLEEALLNALYHGNLEVSSTLKEASDSSFYDLVSQRQNEYPYKNRSIEIEAETTAEETRFVIRDGGPGFDVKSLPDPTDPENLTRPSGRGVMLMHAFMDEVQYNEKGNEVTLKTVRKRS